MKNFHAIARPLRAAVYAILDEDCALERIPGWSADEKMVVWTETTVTIVWTESTVIQIRKQ
jgi:hypothetical protein